MEFNSTKTEEFKATGLSLIHKSGEMLTLVQYPFQAGNRDFFLVDSDKGFKEFLDKRKPKDLVTIFKTFETLKTGAITQDFIDETVSQLKPSKSGDWLVILPRQGGQQTDNWTFAGTKSELQEALSDNLGRYVKILEEPDWLDDNKVIYGYEPDEDGQIRPGAY
jgi:hypothetical protein